MKSTLQIYVEAKYPRETLESLAWLESTSECLGDLLESYRHLQPDGKQFSIASIAKIRQLYKLEELVARHMEERDYHDKMVDHYNQEMHCIENGQEIMPQGHFKEACIP